MKTKQKQNNRILNCLPSKDVQNDFSFKDAMVTGFVKAVSIPASIDLRENWWQVNNQGSTGSCVGWAVADSLLRWYFVNNQFIAHDELLSVRFIWMASKETDVFTERPTTFIEESGTSLKAALDIARKYGCVKDSDLSFNSRLMYDGDENTFYAMASRFKIANYFNLVNGITDRVNTWKNWIADGNGPILVRLDVDSTWDYATDTNGNLDTYDPGSARGGHAVAIVGYTEDRLIIRNSWDDTWGDGGFAYASFSYAENAFTEAYGVTI